MLTINNTLDGYLKDVEIKGNTIQDIENLADIRSVGDKVEGQELYEIPVLSVGKNLFNGKLKFGEISDSTGQEIPSTANTISCEYTKVPNGSSIGIRGFDATSSYAMILEYDSSYNFIQKLSISATGLNNIKTLNPKTNYIKFKYQGNQPNLKISVFLNETVATPYEPYQEDKLTILSPTPLEKVGDVADRIVCKDGVWGVEKNIHTEILGVDNSYNSTSSYVESGYRVVNISNLDYPCVPTKPTLMCNKLKYYNSIPNSTEGIASWSNAQGFIIKLSVNTIGEDSIPAIKDYIVNNNFVVKYPLQTPQFIPLPHDQQVKLRTFANKTNISFLTEIEGTIKAQVPKSLGATVNTHTEQISNLNKELDRVKKLEESTVSTVETESDFTTVEATSNGYFEDVKLEGKTLVNLCTQLTMRNNTSIDDGICINNSVDTSTNQIIADTLIDITIGKTYTVYMGVMQDNCRLRVGYGNQQNGSHWDGQHIVNLQGNVQTCLVYATHDKLSILLQSYAGATLPIKLGKILVLEGDHTQKPPSYFEGLKSVGQGTDEIVVSSVKGDGNLFEDNVINQSGKGNSANGTLYPTMFSNSASRCRSANLIKVKPNTDYYFSSKNKFVFAIAEFDSNNRQILENGWTIPVSGGVHRTSSKCESIIVIIRKDDNSEITPSEVYGNVQIKEGSDKTEYTPYKSDKKRLLFYDEETQTWEKPVLREWDSIEKHANGKYYYHQRSREVVFDGSENWVNEPTYTTDDIYGCYLMKSSLNMKDWCIVISNKFPTVQGSPSDSLIKEGFNVNTGVLGLRLFKSKLSTQDVQGFKQWLQANPVTVVYQLAEEKVYECTNIDLITYANETNYIVESGAIAPKSVLKVHNNISNVVSLLQKKVSLLESNITNYMITQNRMQLASTYSADSVTFKVDYALCSEEVEYNEDLYNLILNNILVGKDNYDYDKMFTMVLDYASWNQISWEQFDILVGLMDIQHNPPIEEIPTDDEIVEEIPNEIM